MYPYDILFDGFNLYVLFITLGVIAALVVFRILADKNKFPAGLQNLVLIGAVISVVVGYCFAVLFQGVYNAFETGKFVINGNTGATFYGGLIGGAGTMLLIFFYVFADRRLLCCRRARIRPYRLPHCGVLPRARNGCLVRDQSVYVYGCGRPRSLEESRAFAII